MCFPGERIGRGFRMGDLKQTRSTAHLCVLFVIILSVCLVSCLNRLIEKPSFILHDISISQKSLAEVNLVLGLDVENQNRFDLTLTSLEYALRLDNEVIGTGRLEEPILLPSLSNTKVKVSVIATFKDLGGSLKTLITKENLPYRIEGRASVKTAFGSRSFPFLREGKI